MEIGSLRLRRGSKGLRAFGLIAAVWSAASCHAPIDTTRVAPPKGTLGDDLFGLFCDRVAASSLTEDTSGASFQRVCHYDAQGQYADKVDESALPVPQGEKQQAARRLALAKMDAMVRRRTELVRALNIAFPDVEIDDPTKGGERIRLHDALMDFSQRIAPLYDSSPYDKAAEPILPSSTRSMARVFDALLESGPALSALAQTWGRQGYRPAQVGLGAVRPALSYPGLRAFASASLNVLSPGGKTTPALTQLFSASKQAMLAMKPEVSKLEPLQIDAATLQPNRPRSGVELAAAIFLDQHDAFAKSPDDPKLLIAARDRRGFVMTAQVGGDSPFVDKDGDGLADVDASGRFVDAMGQPLAIDPPFAIPGVTKAPADALGIPEGAGELYKYLDTSRTAIGAMGRHLVPLVDATITSEGPDAWKSEHETLMYALGGAYLLLGDREQAQYDYATETVKTGSCPDCVPYTRFKSEDSPLPDLAHAVGQILADPESDALLASLADLVENHESTVARLLGAALKIREIALAHDALAAQGKEPLAEVPYETPVWDEMAKLLGEMTGKHPGMLTRLIAALADPAVMVPHGSARHVGDTFAAQLENRDQFTYNHNDINAPSVNLTVGPNATDDPKTPVDRTQPRTGKNSSIFYRLLQVIHDANGGPACNKDGARVKVELSGLSLTWPLPIFSGYKSCELFKFENLAAFYLDSTLPANHPKRTKLVLNDGVLNALMNALGVVVSPDKVFADSSGIDSLTTHPSPFGLNRLVFFGASQTLYPSMPVSVDLLNKGSKTDIFISNLLEPVSAVWCPVNLADPSKTLQCPTADGTLREADTYSLFAMEKLGFYDYLSPLVAAAANGACAPDLSSCDTNDYSGEKLLIEALETFYRHWAGKDHGPECEPVKGSKKYCSEAGLNTYEPIAAEALRSDLVPAFHEFSQVATKLSKITVKRGPKAGEVWTGAEVVEKLASILFDPAYAASMNMVDRKGNKGTKWVDGTDQPQVTVFSLFADALHKIDLRWQGACAGKAGAELEACNADVELRKGQWKRARSQLVDEFAAVEGEGAETKFRDRALPRLLSTGMRVIREQLNAHCPDREQGTACTWASRDFGDKLASTMNSPLFSALVDVGEQLRKDEPARRETEKLLTYMLSSKEGDAQQAWLASLADAMQVLTDDSNMAPILNAAAGAMAPLGDKDGPGVGETGLNLLKAVTSDEFDRYHVMDHILPNLASPTDDGKGLSPIEIIMDTVAEVNRIDAAASQKDPLTTDDYKAIMGTMQAFMADKTRGLEQFYTIIKNRPRE